VNPIARLRATVASALDRRIARALAHLDQRRVVYCGDHVALIRLPSGRPLYLDTRDVSIAVHVMGGGVWEPEIAAALVDLARPDDTFLDVGANFGVHSLTMADHLRGPHPLHLFEPNPGVAALLRRTLLANGLGDRATLCAAALSDRAGEATLVQWPELLGGASLHTAEEVLAAGRPWAGLAGPSETVTVPTVTLDAYCDAHDLSSVDLVKIDVEGHEDAVLAGMTGVLDRSPAARVVLEFTFAAYADPEGFWATLTDAFPHRWALAADGTRRAVRTLGDLQASTPHELANVVCTRTPPPWA
jgi:FkbM family methyltransferase